MVLDLAPILSARNPIPGLLTSHGASMPRLSAPGASRWREGALAGPNRGRRDSSRAGGKNSRDPESSGRDRDYVLDLYLRDVSSTITAQVPPGLKPADEAAREQLVFGNLSAVVQMAFHFRGLGLPLPDLINEGNIGLLRAAELYDARRCVRFAYYARPWIRVHMQRAVSYQAWPINYPADFGWRHSRVSRAEAQLKTTLNRTPADVELAQACGMGLPAVHRLRTTPAPNFVSLDSPVPSDDPGLTLSETIPDQHAAAPDREAERDSDRQFALSLLKILSPTEQRVIRLRYGLEDGIPHTLQEVGRVLGYVRQGIHRLETAALKRLRKHASFVLNAKSKTGTDGAAFPSN